MKKIEETDSRKTSGRYPYTYSCDFIRSIPSKFAVPELDGKIVGVKLSRSDASQIRSVIAEVLGIDDEELAKKLADKYLEVEDEIAHRFLNDYLHEKM